MFNIVDHNLRCNRIDPETATVAQREAARERINAVADIMQMSVDELSESFGAYLHGEAIGTDDEKWAANQLNQMLAEPGYGGGQSGKMTIVRVLGGIQVSREFAAAITSMIAKLNVKN